MERSTVMLKPLVILLMVSAALAIPAPLSDKSPGNTIVLEKNDSGNIINDKASAIIESIKNSTDGVVKSIKGIIVEGSSEEKTEIRNSSYPFILEETHLNNALISSLSILKEIKGGSNFKINFNEPKIKASSTVHIINHINSGKENGDKKYPRDNKDNILNNTFDSILSKAVSSLEPNDEFERKPKRIINQNRTVSGTRTEAALNTARGIEKKSDVELSSNLNSNSARDVKKPIQDKHEARQASSTLNDTGVSDDLASSRRKGKVLDNGSPQTESKNASPQPRPGHDSSAAASQGREESHSSPAVRNSKSPPIKSNEQRGVTNSTDRDDRKNLPPARSNVVPTDTKGFTNQEKITETAKRNESGNDILSKSTGKSSKESSQSIGINNSSLAIKSTINKTQTIDSKQNLQRDLIALNVFKKLSELNDDVSSMLKNSNKSSEPIKNSTIFSESNVTSKNDATISKTVNGKNLSAPSIEKETNKNQSNTFSPSIVNNTSSSLPNSNKLSISSKNTFAEGKKSTQNSMDSFSKNSSKIYQDSNNFRYSNSGNQTIENSERRSNNINSISLGDKTNRTQINKTSNDLLHPLKDGNQDTKAAIPVQWIKIKPQPSENEEEKLEVQEANYLSRAGKNQNFNVNNNFPIDALNTADERKTFYTNPQSLSPTEESKFVKIIPAIPVDGNSPIIIPQNSENGVPRDSPIIIQVVNEDNSRKYLPDASKKFGPTTEDSNNYFIDPVNQISSKDNLQAVPTRIPAIRGDGVQPTIPPFASNFNSRSYENPQPFKNREQIASTTENVNIALSNDAYQNLRGISLGGQSNFGNNQPNNGIARSNAERFGNNDNHYNSHTQVKTDNAYPSRSQNKHGDESVQFGEVNKNRNENTGNAGRNSNFNPLHDQNRQIGDTAEITNKHNENINGRRNNGIVETTSEFYRNRYDNVGYLNNNNFNSKPSYSQERRVSNTDSLLNNQNGRNQNGFIENTSEYNRNVEDRYHGGNSFSSGNNFNSNPSRDQNLRGDNFHSQLDGSVNSPNDYFNTRRNNGIRGSLPGNQRNENLHRNSETINSGSQNTRIDETNTNGDQRRRGGNKYKTNRFETISAFTTDSQINKLYTDTTQSQNSNFVTQKPRNKFAYLSPSPSQRTDEKQVPLKKVTEENEVPYKKSSVRTNRGSIKYKWNPENPEFSYDDSNNYPPQFSYNYNTGTGISAYQKGVLKEINNHKVFVIHGSYNYTAPDGTPILMIYTADENGFHPRQMKLSEIGDKLNIPTPESKDFNKEIYKRRVKAIRKTQHSERTNGHIGSDAIITRELDQTQNIADETRNSDGETLNGAQSVYRIGRVRGRNYERNPNEQNSHATITEQVNNKVKNNTNNKDIEKEALNEAQSLNRGGRARGRAVYRNSNIGARTDEQRSHINDPDQFSSIDEQRQIKTHTDGFPFSENQSDLSLSSRTRRGSLKSQDVL